MFSFENLPVSGRSSMRSDPSVVWIDVTPVMGVSGSEWTSLVCLLPKPIAVVPFFI